MNRRDFVKSTAWSFSALFLSDWRSLSGAEPTGRKRPNILFCIADDATWMHMGAYGCKWVKTPAFDSVAKEGVLFTRAYTPNAKCAPSRACILTGRNSWQLEEAVNHSPDFPAKFVTFPETLEQHGYHVGYTGKGWAPGNPGIRDGKPRQLCGTPYSNLKTNPPTKGISNTDYAANFEEFLAARPEGSPFCFWYGGYEPHRGYEYASGVKKGGKNIKDVEGVFPFWPDNEIVRTDMMDYAFEIEYFDQHLQRMLSMLEKNGELDNTIVMVTADNGMPFPRIKGQEYELSNHLPLAIMWKKSGGTAGRVIEDFVNFIDFAPTILEVAGIEEKKSTMQAIQGKSLVSILKSAKSGLVDRDRDHVLIGKERHDVGRPHDWGYPIRGIVKDNYLYVYNFEPTRWPAGNPETGYLNTDGSPTKTVCLEGRQNAEDHKYWEMNFGKRPEEELYRIDKDPACMENLAGNPEFERVKKALSKQMTKELKKQGDLRILGKGNVYEEYSYSGNVKGFYERYMGGEKVKAGWVNESDFEKMPIK